MRVVDLKLAAIDIRRTLNLRRMPVSPFFFMVGAGISNPPIPLAAEIQEKCKIEAQNIGKTTPPPSTSPIDGYSHWFEQAYPNPADRQGFLREVMEHALISPASFRLAHLLLNKSVTNLVVTANFDDFVARALSLFGLRAIVSDHPRMLERIDPGSADVQVIHLHGSYWFYDCCNLRDDIEERAQRSQDTYSSMHDKLGQILETRSPLVVGYSGWEGDVFMCALRSRLSERSLGFNLYWFCYNRQDAENLTHWLVKHRLSHRYIRIVLPDEILSAMRASANIEKDLKPEDVLIALRAVAERAEFELTSDEGEGRDTEGDSIASKEEPVLRASAVFDELIRRFDLDAPELTRDPLGFFANHLNTSLLGDLSLPSQTDVYAIRAVIERLERLREEEKRIRPSSGTEFKIEDFRNALRQSKHSDAIRHARAIPLADLSREQLLELFTALVAMVPALADSPRDQMSCNDLIVATGDALAQLNETDIAIPLQVADALISKAIHLVAMKDPVQALATCDDVVNRFRQAAEASLRNKAAQALLTKGTALMALKRVDDEIATYQDVLDLLGPDPEASSRELIAKALFNTGMRLVSQSRNQEAIAFFDEIITRFGKADEFTLQEQVAKALFNKGIRLSTEGGRKEDAVATFKELIRQFQGATESTLRDYVARALISLGERAAELFRTEEALTAYGDVPRLYGDTSEAVLRVRVGQALAKKSTLLRSLGRREDEIATHDEIADRFINATEPKLREQVARSCVSKACALEALNRMDKAAEVLDKMITEFGETGDPALRELTATAILNKGVALCALHRVPEAMSAYDEVIKRYADATEDRLRERVRQAQWRKTGGYGPMICPL